jgi:large repetitive protein
VDDAWHTLRARLTVQPAAWPEAKAYVEAEQDVSQHERRLLAFGGSYQLGARTRLFGRYEAISTLGHPLLPGQTAPDHVAALGLESTYLPGHSAFGEFRVRDTVGGRENLLATGLRSRWAVAPGLHLGAGFERTAPLGDADDTNDTGAMALATSADYARPGLRLDARLELRRTGSADSVLNTLGAAWRLDDDWSMLARSAIESTQARRDGAADTLRLRQQLGLAWRPKDSNAWAALARYEHRMESSGSATSATVGGTGDSAGTDGHDTDDGSSLSRTHIVSAHLSHQPRRDLWLNARLAAKWHLLDAEGIRSHARAQLLSARAVWEFAPRWDAGLQGVVRLGQGGVRHGGMGVELGTLLADNLWLSVGFNAFDLRDPALTGDLATQRGVYLRLRFKFDEGVFQ